MKYPVIIVAAVAVFAASCGTAESTSDVPSLFDAEVSTADTDLQLAHDVAAPDASPGDVEATSDNGVPETVEMDLSEDTEDTDLVPDWTAEVVPLCPADCDDGDECTDDSCDPALGCVHELIQGCCPGKTAFSQDFEGEDPLDGYAVEALVPPYSDAPDVEPMVWQVVDSRFHSPTHALYFGDPNGLHYDNGHRVAAAVTTPPFELESGHDQLAVFWAYLDVETGPYSDHLTLYVVSEEQVVPVWTRDNDFKMRVWTPVQVDLTAFAGLEIQLRFAFDSHDEHINGTEGIYIDDLAVEKSCAATAPCEMDFDCAGPGACVDGGCAEDTCQWQFTPDCCLRSSDCEDWDGCTIDKCKDNQCEHQNDPDPMCCNDNDDCPDDGDECTEDMCKNHQCVKLPSGLPGCCEEDAQCDDQDDCTIDQCAALQCFYINTCCDLDDDCDDGDSLCTDDVCVNKKCKFVPTGAEGCCVEHPVEEDFEDGLAQGWAFESSAPGTFEWEVGSADAYQGDKSLSLEASSGGESMASAVLPLGLVPPMGGHLQFWLKMDLPESGDCGENRFIVMFDNQVLGEWCNTLPNWFHVELSLEQIGGQEGELSLRFEVDPWLGGNDYAVYVDKLVLSQACCSTDSDCDDGNPCTSDVCPGGNSLCTFPAIEGCCLSNGQCEDGDPCTDDVCEGNVCAHLNICCSADDECDDGDDTCTDDICVDSSCVFLPTGVSGCCDPIIFTDGFEGAGATDWELESQGNNFIWQITNLKASQGDYSLYFGNNQATDYGEDSMGTATSPLLDLPAGGTASVTFDLWHETESNYDELLLEVVTEDGTATALAVYSGDSQEWSLQNLDVSDHSGQKVHFRFTFESDGSVTKTGVFIDNFNVETTCCYFDVDCDDNDPCTTDSCPGEGSLCAFVPVSGCCTATSQCNDGNPCTVDACEDQECSFVDVCCQGDEDCDDGDDICTQDLCIDSFCSFVPTGVAGCCNPDAYQEGFEVGQGDWTFLNEEVAFGWHLSQAQADEGEFSLYYGNPDGSSYGTSNEGTATSPPIEFPVAPSIELSMAIWLDTEASFDEMQVYVVTDQGENLLGEFSGGDGSWEDHVFDVSAFSGMTAQLRFSFDADGSVSGTGVYVDSIHVTKECCQEDAECNDGNLCTVDSCPGVDSDCAFVPVSGCCLSNIECDDQEPCTQDLCVDNECSHVDVCCQEDTDCDDGDDTCTVDTCVDGLCQFSFQDQPGCCQSDMFQDNFEGGTLAGYEVNNLQADSGWHLTDAQAHEGTTALSFSNADGTAYDSSSDGTIQSAPILVPGFTKTPVLRFWTRYETENCCDRWTVSIIDNGEVIELDDLGGDQWEWHQKEYDLAAFIGKEIRVQFGFHSDGSVAKTGVFIDELQIWQDCCQTDSMCDDMNTCTTDSCPSPNSFCEFSAIEGCCHADSDCDDDDLCTLDDCVDQQCQFLPLCCESDEQCDDGDDSCTGDSCVDGECVYELLEESGCCVAEIYEDAFEGGELAGYTVLSDDEEDSWHITDAFSYQGNFSLAYSNSDDSAYNSSSSGVLISPPIDLAPLVVQPQLSFWALYDTEGCCDEWSVYVQGEAEEAFLGEFAGEVLEWEYHQFDLSDFAGQTIRIRFVFDADGSVNKQGVFIDALRVLQLGCCSEDADCEDDNPCTVNSCPGIGSYCLLEPIAGCCQEVADCHDEDTCTVESCLDGACQYTNVCCEEDEDCDDEDDVCTTDTCHNGQCVFVPTNDPSCCTQPLFYDDFSEDNGWEFGMEWEWGTASASDCAYLMDDDPAVDHTGSADNMLVGVALGGCLSTAQEHDYYYLTSPIVDSSGAQHLYLGYWRWLNSDYAPYVSNIVEVFNGASWITVWTDEETIFGTEDEAWTYMEHDISDLAGSSMQVRFGFKVGDVDLWESPSWNIDDVLVFETNVELCCLLDSQCEAYEQTCNGLMCAEAEQ